MYSMRFPADLRVPLFTILFLFLAFFLYTKLFGPIPFAVSSIVTNKQDLFTVDGVGKVAVVPDTAKVQLGITVNKPRVVDAQNEANRVIKAISDGAKGSGINEKDIKTINYSVNPNYDYTAGTQRIRDYNVSATLEIKITPIDKVTEVVDKATEAGANTVGSIQFTVAEEKEKELRNQARKEAIDQAKEKAQSLASAAGLNLGRVINVYETPQQFGYPLPYGGMSERSAVMATDLKVENPTQVEPGETSINVNVSLTYEVR
jgi:uncharacterized protein